MGEDWLIPGDAPDDAPELIEERARSRLRRLMELRKTRDETKAAAETAEKEYREYEADVWDWIDGSPLVPPVKLDLGEPHGIVSFSPRETFYGRIIDKEKALEYLEDRALQDEFTKPGIVMARVNELVREKIEQAESQPPGMDFYARRFITITVPK